MKFSYYRLAGLFTLLSLHILSVSGQKNETDSSAYYNEVRTYVNPVLPGDHPDPTLLKVGNDFYHCGSSFHFNPYLPIYHSKDLVHWEIISYGSKETGGANGLPKVEGDLKAAGFNAVTYVSQGTAHEFQTWRRSLYQMAPLLFK